MKNSKLFYLIIAVGILTVLIVFLLFSMAKQIEPEQAYEPSATPTNTYEAHVIIDGEEDIKYEPITDETFAHLIDETPYENCVLRCRLRNGGTITVGIDDASQTSAMYLNPRFEIDESDILDIVGQDALTIQYGIYIASSRCPVVFADNVPEPRESEKNLGLKNYYIIGQTYDKLVPAQTSVAWVSDFLYDGLDKTGATIYFRVVRFTDYTIMGCAAVDIVYDADKGIYRLENLRDHDVACEGTLDNEHRAELIEQALQFIADPSWGPRFNNNYEEAWDDSRQSAVIEEVHAFYFPKLNDKTGQLMRAAKYRKCDIFAVSVPFPSYGFITVYFVPQLQIDGMAMAVIPGQTDLELKIVGFDFLAPFTIDTLQISEVYEEG